MLRLALLNRGVVWVDAVQLESGNTATPFQPANADRTLTAHESNVEKELFQASVRKTQRLQEKTRHGWQTCRRGMAPSSLRAVQIHVRRRRQILLFYTEDGIYLGIDADEPDAGKIACAKKTRDSQVWTDPSFEIFVDNKLSRGNYHHLAFNAAGVRFGADNAKRTGRFPLCAELNIFLGNRKKENSR